MKECKLYLDPLFIKGAIQDISNASTGRIFKALMRRAGSGQEPDWLTENERRVYDLLWERHKAIERAVKEA